MGRGGEDVREEARHVPFEIVPSDEWCGSAWATAR